MTKSTLQSLCKPGRIPSREKIPAPPHSLRVLNSAHIYHLGWKYIRLVQGKSKTVRVRSEGNKMGEECKDHAHFTSRAAKDILIL